MSKLSRITLILCISLAANAIGAGWDGGAGTSDWKDAENWSNNLIPLTVNGDLTVDIRGSTDAGGELIINLDSITANTFLDGTSGNFFSVRAQGNQAVTLNLDWGQDYRNGGMWPGQSGAANSAPVVINHTGGNLTVDPAAVYMGRGSQTGSSITYNVLGGTLTMWEPSIGARPDCEGDATLRVNGGEMVVTFKLHCGAYSGTATSTLEISGNSNVLINDWRHADTSDAQGDAIIRIIGSGSTIQFDHNFSTMYSQSYWGNPIVEFVADENGVSPITAFDGEATLRISQYSILNVYVSRYISSAEMDLFIFGPDKWDNTEFGSVNIIGGNADIVYDDAGGRIYLTNFSLDQNIAPAASAGMDKKSYIQEGLAQVALNDAYANDDGKPTGAITTTWSMLSGPEEPVFIPGADMVNPIAQFSTDGVYELQLLADDGELTGSGTLIVTVYENSCQFLKSSGIYADIQGDFNNDCIVDSNDFKSLAQDWLYGNPNDCSYAKDQPGYTPLACDLNEDCFIDLLDFVQISKIWLNELKNNLITTRDLGIGGPAYTHPRVLFSESDLPDIYNRLDNGIFGQKVWDSAQSWIATQIVKELAGLDLSGGVSKGIVDSYWSNNDQRNINFFLTALDGMKRSDADRIQLSIDAIVNYSKILVASKTYYPNDSYWASNDWNLGVAWTSGGEGMALAYDLLYNEMTTAEQDAVRLAIAMATEGRRQWGMGFPKTRIISNWATYNMNLVTMIAAIYGETGFDQEVWDLEVELAYNYIEFSTFESGANFEDGYAQLALREGSLAFVAMARNGDNIFEHPNYQAMVKCYANSLEPAPTGTYVGHASGGDFSYPSFWCVQKYVYPESIITDYNWHYYAGADYGRGLRWQTLIANTIFAPDYAGTGGADVSLLQTELELSTFYPRRGLMISRSDWGQGALYTHLDARPEAYFPGHDNDDRGNFTLTALGRSWVPDDAWNSFQDSQDHSLVHIDGIGQGTEAPSVKFLDYQEAGEASVGVADLKYAYDWIWKNSSSAQPSPWVKDTSTPVELGWPGDEPWATEWTVDNAPDLSFAGTFLWKQPFNPVEKAFRTLLMVRGPMPYVLLIDDVKKDSSNHSYEWYLHLEPDVVLESSNGNEFVLAEEAGNRRLLISFVDASNPMYGSLQKYSKNDIDAARFIASCNAASAEFKILIIPFRKGEILPTVSYTDNVLTVNSHGRVDTYTMTSAASGRTLVEMQRDGRAVLSTQ
jgi:hypothetical protein